MEKESLFGVINTKITRRSFLKWSAAIGATSSAVGLVLNNSIKTAGATNTTSVKPFTGSGAGAVVEWIPTHCLMCHSWCGLAVGLDSDGHICKIEGQGGQPTTKGYATAPVSRKNSSGVELTPAQMGGQQWQYDSSSITDKNSSSKDYWGNPDDADRFPSVESGYQPYNLNNKGRICAKGNNGMQHVYDPDRVKYPLKRRPGTNRGAGQWTKISWRQAYFEIACVIRELNGYSTAPDGTSVWNYTGTGGTAESSRTLKDRRHRYVYYVGRNETDTAGGDMKFGTPNRIEHTSLCESSRHIATLSFYGHHFPFPDLNSHSGARQDTSCEDSAVDFMVEFGGNPCESKIPHASYASRWGDRRRRGARMVVVDVRQSNSAAFADEWIAIDPGTDGALAMGILGTIFENVGATSLKADLLRGHLGGTTHNYDTRRWTGIFSDEKSGPAVFTPSVPDGGDVNVQTFAMGPNNVGAPKDTLEDELTTMFGAGYGTSPSGAIGPAAWAAEVCGCTASDVEYLAGAIAGATLDTGGAVSAWKFGEPTYKNPSVEGYRGPAKHTNGTYNWRALRALQTICGRFRVTSDGRFDPDQSSTNGWGRGGWQRPGGLMGGAWGENTGGYIDDWGAYGLRGGGEVGFSAPSVQVTAAKLPMFTYPYASNKWTGSNSNPHGEVTIDRWDYEQGRTKAGIGTEGIDQNVIPGIRASLGLDPYRVGDTVSIDRTGGGGDVTLPYGPRQTAYIASATTTPGFSVWCGPHAALANLVSGTATIYKTGGVSVGPLTVNDADAATGQVTLSDSPGVVTIGDHLVVTLASGKIPDDDFAVEALMLFKNGVGNTRANIKLAQELGTKKDGFGKYVLKHIWSIDCFMGDFTRFADIILPDTTYLERWDNKDWEIIGLKAHHSARQPVMRKDMTKAVWARDSKELYLYEARPVNSIAMELSNAIAGRTTGNQGFTDYDSVSEIWAANSTDEDYNPELPGSEAQPWDTIALGGIGARKQVYFNAAENSKWPKIPGVTDGKFAWFRTFANFYDSNQVINEYTGMDADFARGGGERPFARHNCPKTWDGGNGYDDLRNAAVVNGTAEWADTGITDKGATGARSGGYFKMTDVKAPFGTGTRKLGNHICTALEVFNKRFTQILEPGGTTSSGIDARYMNDDGYRFKGVPVWQETFESTTGTYPLHLTTYKVNVHTQSRTAANPRQTEIIGNNWAVMHPATATGISVVNGDTVIVETAQGSVRLEAKVTTKIREGIVAISNSFGHEAKGQSPDDIGVTQGINTVYGNTDAFGRYRVGSADNRAASVKASKNDAYHTTGPGLNIDGHTGSSLSYTIGTPSAPGAGVHPNHAIQRTTRNLCTGKALATDPIGTSLAWFDSKCNVTKA